MENKELIHTYLQILTAILQKKEQLLYGLISATKQQKEALEQPQPDFSDFQSKAEIKETLIQELNEQDTQFERLYSKIKEFLNSQNPDSAQEIKRMQTLIPQVIDLGVILKGLEQQNKTKLELAALQSKKDSMTMKKSSKSVAEYYKAIYNMKPVKKSLDQQN